MKLFNTILCIILNVVNCFNQPTKLHNVLRRHYPVDMNPILKNLQSYTTRNILKSN